jgi:hypothetical protein
MDKLDGGSLGHTFPGVSQNNSVKRHLDVDQVETLEDKSYEILQAWRSRRRGRERDGIMHDVERALLY